jgi:hypothetical protein
MFLFMMLPRTATSSIIFSKEQLVEYSTCTWLYSEACAIRKRSKKFGEQGKIEKNLKAVGERIVQLERSHGQVASPVKSGFNLQKKLRDDLQLPKDGVIHSRVLLVPL